MKKIIIMMVLLVVVGCNSTKLKYNNDYASFEAWVKGRLDEVYGKPEYFNRLHAPLTDEEMHVFYKKSYMLRKVPEFSYDREFLLGYKFSKEGFVLDAVSRNDVPKHLQTNLEMFLEGVYLHRLPEMPIDIIWGAKSISTGEIKRD